MDIASGPWGRTRIEDWLARALVPVRLAVSSPRGPLAVSLWYLHHDGALWCATRRDADIVGFVRADPRVGFEVAGDAPPYRGIRGTGRATVVADQGREVLDALLARYLDVRNAELADWLRERADDEVAIRIDDLRVSSWDFSSRMQPQPGMDLLPPG